MTTELLEQRLRDLAVDVPDAGRVTARAMGAGPRRRLVRWPTVGLASIAAVLLVALVAYFVPASGTVVARMPVAGDVLNAGDRVTVVGSSATSSGYTITLVAAYADSTRTELKLNVSPGAMVSFGIGLTDQFGRTYNPTSGYGNALSGDNTTDFEPLAWPDAITGARITVQITELEPGPDPSLGTIKGTWTLHATLGVDEGTAVALPAPVTLGRAHLTFKSIVYTPASVAVDLDITGVTMDDIDFRLPDPNNLKGTPAFTLDVLDPDGSSILGTTSEGWDWFSPIHVHILGNRHGSGRYSIVASYLGVQATRTFSVS